VALLPRSAEGKPYLRPDFPPQWPLSGVAEEDRTTEHPRGCEAAPGGRCRVTRSDLVEGYRWMDGWTGVQGDWFEPRSYEGVDGSTEGLAGDEVQGRSI